jgi:putative aldouronate transport system substrate-binding protein
MIKRWTGKIGGMILTIALTAGMITGCAGKQEESEQTQKENYVTATLFCDVNHWNPPAWDLSEDSITGKITKKTGVQLDTTVPAQDADLRLKILMVNDELPDLISVTDETVISQLVTSGKVWNLEEFLKKYKPDSHLLKDFPEDLKKEMIRRDRAWYALPSHINSEDARAYWKQDEFWTNYQDYSDNNAIIWNIALLKEFGIDTENLQTMEQVLAAYEKVKGKKTKAGQTVIPLLVDGKNYRDPTLKYLEGTFGAEWVDENGDFKDILLQPQTKTALSFLNIAVRKGYMDSSQLTWENLKVKETLDTQPVLCFIGNIANTGIEQGDWTSTGVILSPDGSSPVMGKSKRANGWMSTFVSKKCKHPEEVAEFIDYMTSVDGMMDWYYGEEGEDYTVGEDGKYYRTKQGQKLADASHLGTWWMFENTAWERSVQGITRQEEDMYQVMAQYGSNKHTVIYDASLLFMPADLLADNNKIKDIQSSIELWKTDSISQVVLAESEEAFEQEYEKMLQGLYERGIEQLDDKKNEAYQENCRVYGSKIEKVNK